MINKLIARALTRCALADSLHLHKLLGGLKAITKKCVVDVHGTNFSTQVEPLFHTFPTIKTTCKPAGVQTPRADLLLW